MAIVKTFVFNPFQENTFVVYDDTKECVIVDAGCYTTSEKEELVDFIAQNNLSPKYAINTHGHIDHILGNSFVKETFGIKIAGHPEDLPLMQSATAHAMMYGLTIDDVPTIDIYLNNNDVITFGGTKLKVVHTPGHSLGGICLFCESDRFILTGDTLFKTSIGRTDLPGGNYDQIINSIKSKLLTLPSDTTAFPGHGDQTTIGWEHSNNPFLA